MDTTFSTWISDIIMCLPYPSGWTRLNPVLWLDTCGMTLGSLHAFYKNGTRFVLKMREMLQYMCRAGIWMRSTLTVVAPTSGAAKLRWSLIFGSMSPPAGRDRQLAAPFWDEKITAHVTTTGIQLWTNIHISYCYIFYIHIINYICIYSMWFKVNANQSERNVSATTIYVFNSCTRVVFNLYFNWIACDMMM